MSDKNSDKSRFSMMLWEEWYLPLAVRLRMRMLTNHRDTYPRWYDVRERESISYSLALNGKGAELGLL